MQGHKSPEWYRIELGKNHVNTDEPIYKKEGVV